MKVQECMTKNVICVGAHEPVSVAARLMSRYNLGVLPVQGAGGVLTGVLTDRDVVLRCVAPEREAKQLRVRDIMSSGVVSVRPDESVEQAAALMAGRQLRRLPVAQNGRLVGMLSLADLARMDRGGASAGACLAQVCQNVRNMADQT